MNNVIIYVVLDDITAAISCGETMIETLSEVLSELKKGHPVIQVIISEKIGSGPRDLGATMFIKSDGTKLGTIGGGPVEERVYSEAINMLKTKSFAPKVLKFELTERSGLGLLCGGTIKVLLNPILPKPKLIIFGHGNIGMAVNKIAQIVGFDVIVVERDKSKINEADYPHAKVVIGDVPDVLDKLDINENTFIIIATRDAVSDEKILRHVVKLPVFYIGMIGSKNKGITIKKRLINDGYPKELVERVHVPMGLEIGADTPEEIAVSIMAEIIKVRRLGAQ